MHALLAVPGLVLLAASAAPAQLYHLTSLNGDGAITLGSVLAVNGAGLRVGAGLLSPQVNDHPLIWTADVPAFLPLLPGDALGTARGLNESGVAVGTSTRLDEFGGNGVLTPHAVRWSGGGVTDLRSVVTGGAALTLLEAFDVDDAGRIIGTGRLAGHDETRGWLLDGGTLLDLGSLGPAGASTTPHRLDGRGRVVGTSAISSSLFSPSHAFLWDGGVMHDLHAAAGIAGSDSEALDINESGQICGWASFGDQSSFSAALWLPDGSVLDLDPGDLPGIPEHTLSAALDINEAGEVVGFVYENAFVWRNGVMQDLNSLIVPPQGPSFSLLSATSIDEQGRITATGFGLPMPVLLVPTCDGKFTVSGAGCGGSGGFAPALSGQGCATAGGDIQLAITHGLGGTSGLLLVGAGTGSAPFKGCTLGNLPLLPVSLPLLLGGAGPGQGFFNLVTTLPPALPQVSLHLQAAFHDPGAAAGVTLSNVLALDIH